MNKPGEFPSRFFSASGSRASSASESRTVTKKQLDALPTVFPKLNEKNYQRDKTDQPSYRIHYMVVIF